jgi:hypothetical protein
MTTITKRVSGAPRGTVRTARVQHLLLLEGDAQETGHDYLLLEGDMQESGTDVLKLEGDVTEIGGSVTKRVPESVP